MDTKILQIIFFEVFFWGFIGGWITLRIVQGWRNIKEKKILLEEKE